MARTAPDHSVLSPEQLEALTPEQRDALYCERVNVVASLDDLPHVSDDFRERVRQQAERLQ